MARGWWRWLSARRLPVVEGRPKVPRLKLEKLHPKREISESTIRAAMARNVTTSSSSSEASSCENKFLLFVSRAPNDDISFTLSDTQSITWDITHPMPTPVFCPLKLSNRVILTPSTTSASGGKPSDSLDSYITTYSTTTFRTAREDLIALTCRNSKPNHEIIREIQTARIYSLKALLSPKTPPGNFTFRKRLQIRLRSIDKRRKIRRKPRKPGRTSLTKLIRKRKSPTADEKKRRSFRDSLRRRKKQPPLAANIDIIKEEEEWPSPFPSNIHGIGNLKEIFSDNEIEIDQDDEDDWAPTSLFTHSDLYPILPSSCSDTHDTTPSQLNYNNALDDWELHKVDLSKYVDIPMSPDLTPRNNLGSNAFCMCGLIKRKKLIHK